jgi:hypothetical protein
VALDLQPSSCLIIGERDTVTGPREKRSMSSVFPDLLAMPEGWTDGREHLLALDLSKVRRYTASTGFEYWPDVVNDRVSTSLTDTYLQFHHCYGFGYVGHSYGTLHFDGSFVTLLRSLPDSREIHFEPNFRERTEDGAQIWHIDEIFRILDLPDCERYPWVDMPDVLPRVEVRGLSNFKNREQQDRFIYLCETLLSCHNGAALSARDGRETRGKVVWGEDISERLASGEYIE